MAKKISQLTQATEVKSDDVTVIVQDGETKKLPLNMMVTKQDIENKKIAGLAKLDEIEATYENDTYTPTITVKNKSSVKTGEGDEVDYSANVMDGHAKSAILKGITLVNLLTQNSSTNMYTTRTQIDRGYRYTQQYSASMTATRIQWDTTDEGHNRLKPNTKYYVQFTVKVNKSRGVYVSFEGGNEYATTLAENSTTTIKCSVLCGDSLKRFFVYIYPPIDESYIDDTFDILDFMTIEYQDGMENWDIPYFEGIQSVKLPVLTTTGKNLVVKTKNGVQGSNGSIIDSQRGLASIDLIKIKNGSTYVLSGYPSPSESYAYALFDKNKNYLNMAWGELLNPIDGVSYVRPFMLYNTDMDLSDAYMQLEEGTQATSYEPYKSNILSTPSDLELRGIGDVRDELNLLTGELKENFVAISCNGTEDWRGDSTIDNIRLAYILPSIREKAEGKVICDKLPTVTDNKSVGVRLAKSGGLYVQIDASLGISVKEWLTSNEINIIYEKRDELKVVKTVDLIPSGTHPSTTPYCWKDGHIQLSSSGLLPNLEYSVVTSRAGQINQNATMIVKNDKRIFDLEILLAGGLVNTTYQALTLQNQVETGLSKVSLSSEKEPDYLLYHMIMKLIEEKAYKLDDLAEKVSVFYLYEKLSDTQFETIYSALYPFVEDEIVEEPVVEELPEMVEDEVIM